MDALAYRVESKLEKGNYRGAVRLACGSDIITEHSSTILESQRKKNPTLHPDYSFISTPDEDMFSASITAEVVRTRIAPRVVQMGLVLSTLRIFQASQCH